MRDREEFEMNLTTYVGKAPGLVALTGSTPLRWIARFDRLLLSAGEEYSEPPKDQELVAVVLLGEVAFRAGGQDLGAIGGRASLWAGRPSVVYVPPGSEWSVKSAAGAEIVLCGAPGERRAGVVPVVRREDAIQDQIVGQRNWRRMVRFLMGDRGETQHLYVGECLNPPGNWSGTPPHRHMGIQTGESVHEEAYYFRCSQPQGWGLERTWWPEKKLDVMKLLRDGTATVIPFGYHQVVAAPGYWLDYIFVMAGPVAKPSPIPDPEHDWVAKGAETNSELAALEKQVGA
jgi:5-deoxy-glucuronate isomerase